MSGNKIRKALREEIGEIMELIAKCVQVMQAGGSDQWDESYPNREVIGLDIERGTLYVYIDNEAIAGIIVLDENQAEQYGEIRWSQEQGRHLIMHRLHCSSGGAGQGHRAQADRFCRGACCELRIQQHPAGYIYEEYQSA